MKHIFAKRIFSMLLALVMVIGMIPTATLTAFAAEKTEVTQIETRISAEYVPYAGREYTDLYTYVDTSIYGSAQASGSDWVDDAGVTIEVKGNGDYGEWYDIRYQFEAGRTYTAEYTYVINPAYEETYKFAENTAVTLTNPDPSKCTITGEVIEVSDSGRICDVRYTMTIAGERSYPDIKSATLEKITTPADGIEVETTALMYSNCTLTSQAWSPNVSTFAAGNTYTLTVNLHAKDGYKFADDFAPVLGIKGYEKAADSVQLLNSKKDAAVSFTYSVGDYTYVDTLQFVTNWPLSYFIPTRETSGQPMTFPFDPADGVPFVNRNADLGFSDTTYWYNETDGYVMNYTKTFEAGKVYSLSTVFDIKKDLLGEYRFADNATAVITGPGFSQSGYRVECGDGGTSILVKFLFTAQFPGNEGSSAGNPAMCYTYNEFKYAMENDDIRCVALGDINETMPIEREGLVTAIHVNGIKKLILLGDATFTAPAMAETTYAALLHTESGDTLNISGAGSLTFKAVANNSYNAVIYNQGGSVNVSEGSLVGSYNTAVYGTAIWQEYGELRITGGNFNADNAIAPLSLPTPMSAVIVYGGEASISGGTFRMRNWVDTIDLPYGLQIGKNATVDLSGGTFHGILLPTDSTPLANYMDEDFYTAFTDDSKFNPKSEYSQLYTASGKVVRIAWVIDHVDVHINAPQAGVDINENYFNIPTSGCQATMYYPQWYKNGEPVTYGTFEAGAGYKVVVQIEVKPGYGAEFATGVTAAINNNAVTIKKTSPHWIEIEYDFGVCPNTVSLVELTVTTPKEGEKPSYTVGLGSDAYKLVGNYNTYKDYRQWYMSSDGDEWWEINDTHTFMSGYYYKFVVDIQTASGYEFPLIDNGTIQPDVSATVNGYYARVIKAYEQDPSTYITVEYNFGECNDSVIENIAIVDVQKPVAGERPSYVCNILGSGYQIDRSYTKYYDDWMNDRELYYIKNGIGWWDATKGDWMYENETFTPGHDYMINVYLITENGYEFAYTTKYYENATVATVNGNTAEVEIWNGYWASQREVEYTFTCEEKDVSTVMIYDLDAPKAGEHPDYTATVAYPELYRIDPNYAGTNGIVWYDSQGHMLFPEDTFVEGEIYRVEIKLIPASVNGTNACRFVTPIEAYVNSYRVVANGTWDGVTGNANVVYVQYTFPEGAAAPATPAYTPGDVNGDGKVNVRDIGLMQQWMNGWDVDINMDAGDVTADGKVNVRDIGLMQQYMNGWDVTLK